GAELGERTQGDVAEGALNFRRNMNRHIAGEPGQTELEGGAHDDDDQDGGEGGDPDVGCETVDQGGAPLPRGDSQQTVDDGVVVGFQRTAVGKEDKTVSRSETVADGRTVARQ